MIGHHPWSSRVRVQARDARKPFKFVVNCVGLRTQDVPELQLMVEASKPVGYTTFSKHADFENLLDQMGYAPKGSRNQGLRIANDYHVAYFKSRFKGRPCYFMVHSGIEYIFQEV